jgi:predicted O-linked N-acetylglucosamine transferase (SPINDLY family)
MSLFRRLRPKAHLGDTASAGAEIEAGALIDQGNACQDAGRQREALALYEKAVRVAPWMGRGHLNVGNILLQRGEVEAAIRAYDTAVGHEPGYAAAHYSLGNAQSRLGRYAEALAAYEKALALKPDFVDAEIAMGCVLNDAGRAEDAVVRFRRVIETDPAHAVCLNLLAAVLGRLGRRDEVVRVFRTAIEKDPYDPALHVHLANALMQLPDPSAAAASYRRAIELKPDFAIAHTNLGNALRDLGQLDASLAAHRAALHHDPNLAPACINAGIVLKELGRTDEAIASFRRATQIDPTLADAHFNLGLALRERGLREEAVESYRRAIAARPDFAAAFHNLGVALWHAGRPVDAIEEFHNALRINPGLAESHSALGNALADCGRIHEAVASHRQAIAANPQFAEAHNNLGNALKDLGQLEDALTSYRRALSIDPDYAAAQSNILFVLNYATESDASTRIEEARRFGRILDRRDVRRFDTWPCEPHPQRLRVGMVSGDLRSHPVGYFLQGLLTEVDPSRLELIAYPTYDRPDDVTAILKRGFKAWKPLSGLTDSAAAELIRNDEIHVLIDLAGHTAHNRLEVFACKPAPLQATWLGYFGTSGVTQMDYIIGDRYVTPKSEMHHFTERVWQMPDSYLCFTPPSSAPETAPLPALSTGYVTFGCFNNLSKMSEDVVALWSRILLAVPNSRLMLKAGQLGDPNIRESTVRRFGRLGIASDRLVLQGFSSRSEYLAAYNRVDLALDPFPYPGGTTTVEGYWMGVPAVTRRGDRFLSHNGETIANNAGLADWIALEDDDYVAKAVGWATNLEQLAGLRAELRQRVRASPLLDAKRFARHFETAMWGIWGERSNGVR